MAVPAVPFWVSAAKTEFSGNNGWCSDIIVHSRRTVPRWMSDLGGASDIIPVTLPGGRHGSMNVASYVNFEAGKKYSITIPGDASYFADNVNTPALICQPPGSVASCTLIIKTGAHIIGHGGNGGVTSTNPNAVTRGGDGGPALRATNNVTIQNSGDVRGGGGGGGGSYAHVSHFDGINLGYGGAGGGAFGGLGGNGLPGKIKNSGANGSNGGDYNGGNGGPAVSGRYTEEHHTSEHDSTTTRDGTSSPGSRGGDPGNAGGAGISNGLTNGANAGGNPGPAIQRV